MVAAAGRLTVRPPARLRSALDGPPMLCKLAGQLVIRGFPFFSLGASERRLHGLNFWGVFHLLDGMAGYCLK